MGDFREVKFCGELGFIVQHIAQVIIGSMVDTYRPGLFSVEGQEL